MHSLPSDFVLRTLESTKSVIVGETPIASALDFTLRTLEGVMAFVLKDFLDILQLDLPPYYSLAVIAVNLDPMLYDAVMFGYNYVLIVEIGVALAFAFRITEKFLSRHSDE